MKFQPIAKGIRTIELESWGEYYELVLREFMNAPAYVYRGQADAAWPTLSSLDRWGRAHSKKKLDGTNEEFLCPPVSRELHLRRFRQMVRSMSPIDLSKEDDGPAWALAQHHGLKTPLLDWSFSPFVALYFAFEHPFVHHENQLFEPSHRAVLCLSTSLIPETKSDKAAIPRVYSPSGPVSQRLLAQSSIFLEMPKDTDLETYVAQHFANEDERTNPHARAVLLKVVIPNEGRLDCLRMLNKMNINRVTLFPDLDGAARYINDLWELDPASTLGVFEDKDYIG
jgi:hypothetical protein